MGYFGVIDTETNWFVQVMSIGAVIGDEDTLRPAAARYYIFPEEAAAGGIEFTCFEDKPGAAVPLQIEVMR